MFMITGFCHKQVAIRAVPLAKKSYFENGFVTLVILFMNKNQPDKQLVFLQVTRILGKLITLI